MITLEDRILLNDGTSVVSEEIALKELISAGKLPSFMKVKESPDTKKYKEKYGIDLSVSEAEDSVITPEIFYTDRDEMNMVKALSTSYRHNNRDKKYTDRLMKELKFFEDNHYIGFVCVLHKLIKKFKDDNVVWGVGRGSSCASYVLYLLEVHDIDPIKYDISFSEFSKEK